LSKKIHFREEKQLKQKLFTSLLQSKTYTGSLQVPSQIFRKSRKYAFEMEPDWDGLVCFASFRWLCFGACFVPARRCDIHIACLLGSTIRFEITIFRSLPNNHLICGIFLVFLQHHCNNSFHGVSKSCKKVSKHFQNTNVTKKGVYHNSMFIVANAKKITTNRHHKTNTCRTIKTFAVDT
jgi:hypothetical protein